MSNALDSLLRPRSIAVVGASRRRGTIGWQILHNLVTHGYQGVLYPVNPQGLRGAYREVLAAAGRADAELRGVLVEAFRTGGKETIVGMTTDPSFGPLLMFGLGGVYVEALKDVAFRVQPVSEIDARDMIGSIRASRLLEGMRGEPGVDREQLVDVIQRVSQLVGEHHRIHELDVNPFLARPEGGVALDARIQLGENGTPKRG